MFAGTGTRPVIETTCSGLVPQVTSGGSFAASSRISRSKWAPSSDSQRVPIAPRLVPGLALRRLGPVLEVGKDLLVGRDEAGLGAGLDRHVADGHAAFHGERADRVAGIFEGVAGAAGGADLADDGEDDVLRR